VLEVSVGHLDELVLLEEGAKAGAEQAKASASAAAKAGAEQAKTGAVAAAKASLDALRRRRVAKLSEAEVAAVRALFDSADTLGRGAIDRLELRKALDAKSGRWLSDAELEVFWAELAPEGITCNILAPGSIITDRKATTWWSRATCSTCSLRP
jgi:hypothetical protein